MRRGKLRVVGRWGVFVVALTLVVVGTASFVSYGEATLVRSVRLNWWDGNLSAIWGERSGASGALVSLDELSVSVGFHSRGLGFSSAGVLIPGHYVFAVGVGLLVIVGIIRFEHWLSRVGLESIECKTCGYSLVGLGGGVCPECGEGTK